MAAIQDGMLELKIHPNFVVFGFCLKSLSIIVGLW